MSDASSLIVISSKPGMKSLSGSSQTCLAISDSKGYVDWALNDSLIKNNTRTLRLGSLGELSVNTHCFGRETTVLPSLGQWVVLPAIQTSDIARKDIACESN